MKKRIFALSMAAIMITSAPFAKDAKPVPPSIIAAFDRDFENVTNIHWITTKDFYKAFFTVNESSMEAFYSFDGGLIAQSKKITMDQLPITLLKKAKEKIGKDQRTYIYELLTDSGMEYLLFLESDETKIYKNIGNNWVRY